MLESFIDAAGTRPPVHEAFVQILVKAGCTRRNALLLVEHRGLGGEPPRPLRANSLRLSAERVRQVVSQVEAGPMQALLNAGGDDLEHLRADVAYALRRIERYAPGTDEDIKRGLASDFEPLETMPASVIRIADLLGVPHSLRITMWSARAKFADDERISLASMAHADRQESVTGIVPDQMPEIFENFINFARKHSRGAGVVAAGRLAERYGSDRGVALAPHEAEAFLRPFAVHLGRHEGDEWFSFFNSANEFIHKASMRVKLFGQCSFELVRQFHERNTRSKYKAEEGVPESVLRAALELAGFSVEGDDITPLRQLEFGNGRRVPEIQARMVSVFQSLARKDNRKTVRRAVLIRALLDAGIRESTVRIYLDTKGLFLCKKGLCRLIDEAVEDGHGGSASLQQGQAAMAA